MGAVLKDRSLEKNGYLTKGRGVLTVTLSQEAHQTNTATRD